MAFTGTKLRVAPRIVARQYAKHRADLYLQQKFFEELLAKIGQKEPGVISLTMEIPGRLNEIRKVGKDAASEWMALSRITKDPKAHYQDALSRGVRQLRLRGESSRLEAYQDLLSGKAKEDLTQILAQLEAIGAHIVQQAKKLREDRREKKKEKDDSTILDAVKGLFDTNGDGFIDQDEIDEAVGRLELFLAPGEDADEFDDDDDENFGDEEEDDDDDAEADYDDDDEVGRGGRGGGGRGGGGRGGRGGGFRGGRGGGGRHRYRHFHGGGYWGPTIVPYYSDWDLPEEEIVDTPDGPMVLRRRPRVIRRILD